jgi:hypothetical protein
MILEDSGLQLHTNAVLQITNGFVGAIGNTPLVRNNRRYSSERRLE